MTLDYRAALHQFLDANAAAAPLAAAYDAAIREASRRELETAVELALGAQARSRELFGDAHPISCLLQFLCCDLMARANDPERATQQFTGAANTLVSVISSALPGGDEGAAHLIEQLFSILAADSKLQTVLARYDRNEANLRSLSELATPLLGSQPGQARLLMQAVLMTHRLTKGADHDDTLQAAHKLCAALMSMEDYAAAGVLARDIYERRVRRHGAGHVLAQRAGGAFASALFKAGRRREGLALQHQIYQVSRAAHGEDHQQTRTALDNLLEMQRSA